EPKTEEPKSEEPKSEEPKSEEPKSEEPKTEVKPEVKAKGLSNISTSNEKSVVGNATPKNSLPETGESASIVSALGLTLLVASGYASMRRREDKK
ncbi:TPA: LPXTG cell wall anchor domain-containing protein, partial [Streptococcus suis]|nr:LPXTG cell wall anchor domain-containing protein [Streptococcus suis]